MQQDLQELLKNQIRKRNQPEALSVFELKSLLDDYPDDMKIYVGQEIEELLFLEIVEKDNKEKYLLLSVDQPSHDYNMQEMLDKYYKERSL